ncbi:DUF3592 domain-containing protein [Actinorugispora endophytica]|uniref:Uncharacterized protein DUF3592 n=1 Tax=Actinorugispora endophytica TaxID=1605990 RepID=A0A4R6URQ7_9ACTN|nr:DUF3592 domain-containing protein [Actinorugispora endophytica]TDQ49998.1 uncharacterized protein DUF3592 [Actinorugispora endophytica]
MNSSDRSVRISFGGGGNPGGFVLGVFGLVLLVLGVVFTLVGGSDYSDHTGRAEAVVVEREVDTRRSSDGRSRSDVDVYVSYEVEGTRFEHVSLSGLDPSDHDEGERLTVAYHPDSPESPVTVGSTEPGAFDIFRYIGIAAGVAGLACLGGAAALFLRKRS